MNIKIRNLIDGIKANNHLGCIKDCPKVSVEIGKEIYGREQEDLGVGEKITGMGDINKAIGFIGSHTEMAVWHFQITLPKVHHFVVIPWYRFTPLREMVYTIFMAYENKYTLNQYVNNEELFKPVWNTTEIIEMLSSLFKDKYAWRRYFGVDSDELTTEILYWKYSVIG